MNSQPGIRCAIYTRKSTLDGLEQEFNTLDAQHEACAAFIASQRHEGWKLSSKRYDDGGVSGGTLKRPGLQQLLADIDAGQITMVVVYKIDRLTRSLTDFAKMVERLDAAGCSFVSVTQAFNTSNSMGRLTLNVLLSFAQFEREVTAERIRDKIAASKKKGMWMGGLVPLGYQKGQAPKERELVIHPDEAKTVQAIFKLYIEHGCLRIVQEQAASTGLRSKHHQFASGKVRGGSVMTRGQIHYVLTNPIYVGFIRHKDKLWPGLQEAIINQALWDQVQERLQSASFNPRRGHQSKSGMHKAPTPSPSPLAGKFYDETGDRLTPSHSNKAGKRYRYYISNRLLTGRRRDGVSGWRLPAPQFEAAVVSVASKHLETCAKQHSILSKTDVENATSISKAVNELVHRFRQEPSSELRVMLKEGRLSAGEISIELNRDALAKRLGHPEAAISNKALSFTAPFQIRKRGVELRIVAGDYEREPDAVLLKSLAKTHRWVHDIKAGKSLAAIASSNTCSPSYIRQRIRLAFLSPRIQASILDGTHPVDLTLAQVLKMGVPLDWREQERVFGFKVDQ